MACIAVTGRLITTKIAESAKNGEFPEWHETWEPRTCIGKLSTSQTEYRLPDYPHTHLTPIIA
jgi:hypothetical protein